jgi:heat shock protein HslJ
MTRRRAAARVVLAVVAACAVAMAFAACAPTTSSPSGPSSPNPGDPAVPGLAGTGWTVISIDGTQTIPMTPPEMTFGADGTISGSGGCNEYSGRFQTDGDKIQIGEVLSTMMLCEGPGSAQEAAFLAGLRGATNWRPTPEGNLEISGAAVIVAEPGIGEGGTGGTDAPAIALPGTTWSLVEMGGTADFAHLVPTITFGTEGGISGFAGCNTFRGTYTTVEDQLTLGSLGTTKIGCQRPASVIEPTYLDALTGVATWWIGTDGRLTLDGAVPLIFAPG